MTIHSLLAERGLVLPPEPALPPDATIPFCWARVHGDRVLVSGHGALTADGAPAGPFGAVPAQVAIEAAQRSACQALLSILATVERTVGDLGRIRAWLSVTCFVNAEPGFDRLTVVANPMSELIVAIFGSDHGAHSRITPGVAALPFNLPVIVAAELVVT